jgi:hypothetical protein
MWGGCLSARGDARVGNHGEKALRGIELSGADCRTCGACAAIAGATSTDEGDSSVSGNAGTASGSVWNDGDASEDKVDGNKKLRRTDTGGAQDWNQRVYRTTS